MPLGGIDVSDDYSVAVNDEFDGNIIVSQNADIELSLRDDAICASILNERFVFDDTGIKENTIMARGSSNRIGEYTGEFFVATNER